MKTENIAEDVVEMLCIKAQNMFCTSARIDGCGEEQSEMNTVVDMTIEKRYERNTL